jgi:hypothetical protein
MCQPQRDDLLEAWAVIFNDRRVVGETPSEVRHAVMKMKMAHVEHDTEPTEDHEAARYARHWSEDPKHWAVEERDE